MSYYSKQLKDDKWQKLRLKIISRDKHKCTKCGCDKDLVVHHLYYVYGHKPWEYPQSALTTLCSTCHEKWHSTYDIVIRPSIADTTYKPTKKNKSKKGKVKVIKELVNYKVPNKDLRTINYLLKNLSYKDRQKYLKDLQSKYKLKKV